MCLNLFPGTENGSIQSDSEKVEDDSTSTLQSTNGFQSPSKDNINERLREQLKLLKMGKTFATPIVPRLDQCRKIITRRNTISTSLPMRKPSISLDSMKPTKNGIENSMENHVNSTESLNASENVGKRKEQRLSGGVIESLFKRLKSFEDESTENGVKRTAAAEVSNETKIKKPNAGNASLLKVRKISAINQSAIEQREESQHSTDEHSGFIGFESISKTANISSLLPTPRVERSCHKSVFISEELDAFMKENALENVAKIEIFAPPKVIDEAMITEDAQPPNMSIPERPLNMQKPRTLAEKRAMLLRLKDVRHLMVEHESTVYHELRKRVKFGTSYSNAALETIQDANLPFTRDCWRVASWINTKKDNFFYQTIRCDGDELKLTGGRGNNEEKSLAQIDSDTKKFNISKDNCNESVCAPIKNVRINNYEDYLKEIDEKHKIPSMKSEPKLVTRKLSSMKREYVKPSPLCNKVKNRRSFDIEFSEVEILELPKVQLEVWPEVGRPLPDSIRPLMKTIIGEDNIITPAWANFAASVVQQKNTPTQSVQKQRRKFKKPSPERKMSIVFDIPYVNNQTKMLVRRRRKPANYHNIVESISDLDKELQFKEKVDHLDPVAVECADVLSDMIHSVAVTLNENNFIHNDPDIDYVGKIIPIETLSNGNKLADKDKSNSKVESAAKMKIM